MRFLHFQKFHPIFKCPGKPCVSHDKLLGGPLCLGVTISDLFRNMFTIWQCWKWILSNTTPKHFQSMSTSMTNACSTRSQHMLQHVPCSLETECYEKRQIGKCNICTKHVQIPLDKQKYMCIYIYIYIYIYMAQTGSTQTAKTMIAPVASDDLAILDRTLP